MGYTFKDYIVPTMPTVSSLAISVGVAGGAVAWSYFTSSLKYNYDKANSFLGDVMPTISDAYEWSAQVGGFIIVNHMLFSHNFNYNHPVAGLLATTTYGLFNFAVYKTASVAVDAALQKAGVDENISSTVVSTAAGVCIAATFPSYATCEFVHDTTESMIEGAMDLMYQGLHHLIGEG